MGKNQEKAAKVLEVMASSAKQYYLDRGFKVQVEAKKEGQKHASLHIDYKTKKIVVRGDKKDMKDPVTQVFLQKTLVNYLANESLPTKVRQSLTK